MKRIKTLAALLAATLLFALCIGCGPKEAVGEQKNPGPSEEGGAVTFTDMMGREITLDKPAERIVVLAASDCEILYAIGAGDTLVGRGEYCDYPAQVQEVPAIGSGGETNVEQIIAL